MNHVLLQHEQTLKEELEKRKARYKHDVYVHFTKMWYFLCFERNLKLCFCVCFQTRVHHEERIANYKKILQDHKDYYYNNPLAQKLLALQSQRVEIESQIKACDDQISVAQKELDMLTGNKYTYQNTFCFGNAEIVVLLSWGNSISCLIRSSSHLFPWETISQVC